MQRTHWFNFIRICIYINLWMLDPMQMRHYKKIIALHIFSFVKPLRKCFPNLDMLLLDKCKVTRLYFNEHNFGSDVNLLHIKFSFNSSRMPQNVFNPLQVHQCKFEFLQHLSLAGIHHWLYTRGLLYQSNIEHLNDIIWSTQMYKITDSIQQMGLIMLQTLNMLTA